ncbi:MAG TPA: Mut7-C RNAse domain-containing protein, partial [Candidatus Binataceae bacterium]|nr:Mut7-C RNAse domain-containing protein [Candidatus Binataceae bacterium]
FAADRMLARLARWLRLCGVDVSFDAGLGGGELLAAARREQRIVLTRDKRLRTAPDVLYFSSQQFREQLREVLERFAIDPHRAAFTRCSRCNSLLREVSRESIAAKVPPYVYASQNRFSECPGCGRIYWRATHPDRIMAEIARAESAPPFSL